MARRKRPSMPTQPHQHEAPAPMLESLEPRLLLSTGEISGFWNGAVVNIPDNGGASGNYGRVSLNVSGAPSNATITDVDIYYEIKHTYVGDIKAWATTDYGGGNWQDWVMWNREGGGADNIAEWEYGIDKWDGASANRTWWLVAGDYASTDTGYLDFFEVHVHWYAPDPQPDLTPYKPSGWSDKIVVSTNTGDNTDDSPLYDDQSLYLDWAVINNGPGNATNTFYTNLYVDGSYRTQWSTSALSANNYAFVTDYSLGTLSAGSHTLRILTDANGNVSETSESNNEYTKTINVQPTRGNANVTVRNQNSTTVTDQNAWVEMLVDGSLVTDWTNSSGVAEFSSIKAGTWSYETYYAGPGGTEYWGDDSVAVTAGGTASDTFTRFYPFVSQLRYYDVTAGQYLSGVLPAGHVVQPRVTVTNRVSQALDVQTQVIVDRDRTSSWDYDQTSGFTSVSGGGGTVTINLPNFTPQAGQSYDQRYWLTTRLLNGHTPYTDTAGFYDAFDVEVSYSLSLTQASFDRARYAKGDDAFGQFVLYNAGDTAASNLHLDFCFESPDGTTVVGLSSSTFSIPSLSTYDTGAIRFATFSASALAGAYLPIVTVRASDEAVIDQFTVASTNELLPVIPVGSFPDLHNIIVRGQEHFSASDTSSVAAVLQQFAAAGIRGVSLSVKLDDGAGLWAANSPISGQVLFTTANATPSGHTPLFYDLYAQAQSSAASLGMTIDPWIPTFYDRAALLDHPTWELQVGNGQLQQDFIDPYLAVARAYEVGLIDDVTSTPFSAPERVYLDHFRYTYGQHSSSAITGLLAVLCG